MLKSIGLLVIGTAVGWGQDGAISAQRIREHTRYLSSDQLEGRGVGARGGDLATEYIANQLALAGAKPAGESGTFFQKVPLVGVETQPESELKAAASGKGLSFKWGEEFVGVNLTQRPNDRFEGDAVFVGHGISASEFKWDDYKGVDVTGKILVLFTNEPTSTDPRFFDGRALTYYDRWTWFPSGSRYGESGQAPRLACGRAVPSMNAISGRQRILYLLRFNIHLKTSWRTNHAEASLRSLRPN